MTQRDRRVARAAQMYALLLRLYPPAHRRAFGDQMVRAFGDHYRDAVETRGEPEARFWLAVAGDECKSLLREHLAALAVRTRSMKNLLHAVWEPVAVVAALALLAMLTGLSHVNSFSLLLAAVPIYLALLFLVVRLARSMPWSSARSSWWRLGLLLGGSVGFYMVALDLLDALAPIPGPQDRYGDNVGPVWVLAVPLLAGVVGVVAGYAGRRARTEAAAALLAGGMTLLMQIAGTVLVVVVLWGPLRADALHSQLQAGAHEWIQHQWSVQHPGLAPSLWAYLTTWNDDASIAFGVIFKSAYTIIAWPIPAIVGSAIGSRAARQTFAVERAATSPDEAARVPSFVRPLGFTTLLFVLGILMWSAFTVFASRPASGNPALVLDYLRASFATPAFFAWFLVFLVMMAAVYLAVWPSPARRPTRPAASGV